jgi:hypothetical protein
MASTPSFMTLVVLLLGATMLVAWVVSRALEEQLLGRARRVRQRAVKVVGPLPRARVHQRS